MKTRSYEEKEILALLPLLRSITRELEERSAERERIEEAIEILSALPDSNEDEIRLLVGEVATHRREIRRAGEELERLGCSVVGTEPLTLRIPGKVGEARRSFVWQAGKPVAEMGP